MSKPVRSREFFSIVGIAVFATVAQACDSGGDDPGINPTPTPTGSLGPKPSNAYSAVGEPVPEGATTFSGTIEEWNQKIKDGVIIEISDKKTEDDKQASLLRAADTQQTIDSFVLAHPELKPKIDKLLQPVKRTSSYALKTNLRLQGGNYLQDIPLNDGSQHTIAALGDSLRKEILASGLRPFLPENALATQKRTYSHLYDRIKKTPEYAGFLTQFKSPEAINAMTDAQLVKNEIIKFQIVLLTPVTLLPKFPPNPENEEGFNLGSDRTQSGCNTASATGIIGSNYSYPLRNFTTSVKEQGARGTCTAFAVNGALEAAMARDTGRFVNLSEQELYYKIGGEWWVPPYSYGEGASASLVFQKLMDLGDTHFIPLENVWDYNPAYSRTEDDEKCGTEGHPKCEYKYTHTCDGYNEPCSNTSGEGKYVCVQQDGWNLCGYTGYSYTVKKTVNPTAKTELWDATDPDSSIIMSFLALTFKDPLVAGLDLTESFGNVGASGLDGYLIDSPDNDPSSYGGHNVLVVGYVDDDKLPPGAPKAGNYGGGGYFIIKNSWGTCFSDKGYIYLPYGWMKRHLMSMTALTGTSYGN